MKQQDNEIDQVHRMVKVMNEKNQDARMDTMGDSLDSRTASEDTVLSASVSPDQGSNAPRRCAACGTTWAGPGNLPIQCPSCGDHEHQFPEEATPEGVRVLLPCLLCGLAAGDALIALRAERTAPRMTERDVMQIAEEQIDWIAEKAAISRGAGRLALVSVLLSVAGHQP